MQLSHTLHCHCHCHSRLRRLQTLVGLSPKSSSRDQACTDARPLHYTAPPIHQISITGPGLEASPDPCVCCAGACGATSRSPSNGFVRPRIAAARHCRPTGYQIRILAWILLHRFPLHFCASACRRPLVQLLLSIIVSARLESIPASRRLF